MGLSGVKQVHVWKSLDAFSQVGRVLFQICLVVLGYKVVGLFLGHITSLLIASATAVLFLYFQSELDVGIPRWNQFLSLLRYARFSWLERFRSQTFAWMDILILGFFVTSSAVATYQVAWTISMTFGIFSSSISETLFPELSGLESKNETERISNLLSEGFVYTAFIPIPGFFGSIVLGREVLRLFGPEFTDGFLLLVSLAALSIVLSFDSQFRTMIDSLNYPRYTFQINLLFILLNLVLNLVLIYYAGALGAAIASLLSILASSVYSIYLLKKILKLHLPLYEIGLQFIGGIVMCGVIWFMKQIHIPQNPVETVIFAGLGATIYFVVILSISVEIRGKANETFSRITSSTHQDEG
jgi:O-antigen/teichoic acid export membrane protein